MDFARDLSPPGVWHQLCHSCSNPLLLEDNHDRCFTCLSVPPVPRVSLSPERSLSPTQLLCVLRLLSTVTRIQCLQGATCPWSIRCVIGLRRLRSATPEATFPAATMMHSVAVQHPRLPVTANLVASSVSFPSTFFGEVLWSIPFTLQNFSPATPDFIAV